MCKLIFTIVAMIAIAQVAQAIPATRPATLSERLDNLFDMEVAGHDLLETKIDDLKADSEKQKEEIEQLREQVNNLQGEVDTMPLR
jgi:peptidoglycan hydrolase CwlO-like protein